MTVASGDRGRALPPGIGLRPAREADLAACAELWRDGINDYIGRLNQPLIPPELAPIRRLHDHLHASDAERFWVAERTAGSAPVAFASAARRDGLWYLSMLFVAPREQGHGLGGALLRRILPGDDATLATATDSLQPISNALYAANGIVPRMPLLSVIGRPREPTPFGPLPAGVAAIRFEDVAGGAGGAGHRELVDTVDRIDRAVLGFAHPQDHRFLRSEGRTGFLYRDADGSAAGYGYASEVGRVGPVAVLDEALVVPILGHLLTAVVPRGASALWVPGDAGDAVAALLRAGLRLDGFPVLLCWSRPFADFRRYLPISPGLL